MSIELEARFDEAIRYFERALALAPESVQARYYLGNALFLKGNTGEALSEWLKVVRAQPSLVPALNEAAWVLATSRDASLRNGAEAVELAERAVELSKGARESSQRCLRLTPKRASFRRR